MFASATNLLKYYHFRDRIYNSDSNQQWGIVLAIAERRLGQRLNLDYLSIILIPSIIPSFSASRRGEPTFATRRML